MKRRVALAVEIFQPTPTDRPGNCAEAIFTAFEPDHLHRPSDKQEYRRLAKGRAPGGSCGAFHAGAAILTRLRPDLLSQFESVFKHRTGCTNCRTIRRHRHADCRACVEVAADFLDDAIKEQAD
jgi:hypothetical protein